MAYNGDSKKIVSSSFLYSTLQTFYTKIKGLLDNKITNNPFVGSGTSGKSGYIAFAQLVITSSYTNRPIEFELICRGRATPCYVSITFANGDTKDPTLSSLSYFGTDYGVFAQKTDTSTWLLYHTKSESYDNITVTKIQGASQGVTITHPGTFITEKPTENVTDAVLGYRVGYSAKTTSDSDGQQINTTYIKGLSVSGKTITYTKGDNTTGTITTQDTNTTYSNATTSAAGLMSASDKSKLDGMASGANKYSLPTASSSTLGGVKTTSTVTSNSGYTACPIISGVPYYKDTNTTYSGAGSSLGLVKTGGDVTISSGVITVNDDSHNHIISNVDGLQTQLDNKSDKTHTHSPSDLMYSSTIDLSASTYDQDTYYPVVGNDLPYTGFCRIKVAVQLNSGTKPKWSNHDKGFTCNMDLLVKAGGWGTTGSQSMALDYSYAWTDTNPCGFYQLTNDSFPVLWLRGGGKYFVWHDYKATWSIKTSEYTSSNTTITPTKTNPGIQFYYSNVYAHLKGNADTATNADMLDGCHGDSYMFNYNNYGAAYFGSNDLNVWTRGGSYAIQSDCANAPSSRGTDTWGTILVVRGLSDRITQYASFWNEAGQPLWYRCLNSSSWTSWTKVRDGGIASAFSGWADNRYVNTKPNDYNAKFEVKGLKSNASINSPDNSSFSTVLGLRAWGDYTGGDAHELAFTAGGQIFQRHGSTDSWSSWNRLYTSQNITYGTSALTPGSSSLATGNIYLQYE